MKSPLMYLGTSLIVLLTAALIGPMFIDWSNYHGILERYGSELAGRAVKIEGSVRIRLLPSPVLRVNDVRIANLETATAADFVKAQSIEIRLGLSPLLKGRVEVEAVEFERTTFEFERIEAVGGNWHLGAKDALSGMLSLEDISLETATIRDSTIVLRDGARGGVARLDDVDLDVSAASLIGPYRIRGTFNHEKQPVAMSIATGRRTADGEMRLSINLTPEGKFKPNYGFDGRMLGVGPDAMVEGKLHIARSLPASGEEVEPAQPAQVGMPFSFRSSVRAGLSKILLEDIELLVDQAQPGASISGAMDIGLGDTINLSVDLVARHLDLDRIAGRAGLDTGDFIPQLQVVDRVTRLLQASPKKLNGGIRLDINALTVGGETLEAVEFRAELADRALTITRIGGVLPGRSALELTGLKYGVRMGRPGFEGDVKFISRDTNGFMHWAAPGLKQWLNATTRGFKGRSLLSGRIVVDGRRLAVTKARLELDEAIATGALSFASGERPKVSAELTFDQIDFDRYLPPTPDGRSVDGSLTADPFSAAFAGLDPALFADFDGTFAIRTGRFKGWRRSGDELTASLEALNGGLLLHRVVVKNFHQLDLALDGRVKWIGGRPQGRLTAKLDSAAPGNLLDLDHVRRMLPTDISNVRLALNRMAPAAVGLTLETITDGAQTHTVATAKGVIAKARVSAKAEFTGDWHRFRFGAVKLKATASSARSDTLLGLVGYGAAGDELVAAHAGSVQLSMDGSLVNGVDFELAADVHGTRFDVHGLVSDVGDQLSAESTLTITSDDATTLYRAVGLLPAGTAIDPSALNLNGLVSASSGEFVITGLGGKIGEVTIGLDGTASFRAKRPQFFGNLIVAEIDLPWVVSRGLALPSDRNQTDDKIWSVQPFGLSVLNAIDLNLALRAGALKLFGGATADRVQAEVTIADGTVVVERLQSAFAKGNLTVDLRLVGRNGQLGVEGRFDLRDAELASTFTAAAKQSPLQGRYSLEGSFNSSGRSPIGIVSALTGKGTLKVDQASLRGVNPQEFSEALREVATAEELDGLIKGVLVDGEMAFSGLKSGFTLENGLVRFAESDIESPAATGRVNGYFDLPAWRMDSEWTVSLKEYPNAPPLNVVLAGPVTEPHRSYDTKALQSFFVVKGLTAGVQKLEQIQRDEEERIRRLEELERKARIELARRTEELINTPDPEVFMPPEPEVAPEPEVELPADVDAAVPLPELLVRTPLVDPPVPGVPTIDEMNQFAPSTTGTVTPSDLAPVKRGTVVAPLRQPPADVAVPDPPAQKTIRLEPLPAPRETVTDDGQQAIDNSDTSHTDGDILDPEIEIVGEPVDLLPDTPSVRTQQKVFEQDPSSWRK